MSEESSFLSRWSQRKAQARQGVVPAEPVVEPGRPAVPPGDRGLELAVPAAGTLALPVAPPPAAGAAATTAAAAAATTTSGAGPPEPPPPTMDDVAQLTRESDFSRFVARGVDGDVKNAALKKLFGDPHFNTMDGLDVYIDDYSKPDPLPLTQLRKMAQAAFLGLIEATPASAGEPADAAAQAASAPQAAAAEAAAGALPPVTDEDPDLRLQSHDAAGCGGAEEGAAGHERRTS